MRFQRRWHFGFKGKGLICSTAGNIREWRYNPKTNKEETINAFWYKAIDYPPLTKAPASWCRQHTDPSPADRLKFGLQNIIIYARSAAASLHIQCSSFRYWQEIFNYTNGRSMLRITWSIFTASTVSKHQKHSISPAGIFTEPFLGIFSSRFWCLSLWKKRWSKVTRFAKLRPTKRWRI